jgi:bifunctional DNase/RNase
MKAVDLLGISLEANSGAPLIVLREKETPFRYLPIFVGESEAASIAIAMSGTPSPRPLTHDLMAKLMQTLETQLQFVEVTELRDGSYIAEMTVSSPSGDQCFDTRPSDGIALAVRLGAPMFVSEEVMDRLGAMPNAEPDEEAIEAEVEEFREFLDEVDPSAFR